MLDPLGLFRWRDGITFIVEMYVWDNRSMLIERCLVIDIDVVLMKGIDVCSNHRSVGIVPGPRPNSVTRIDRVFSLSAEIGDPRAITSAGPLSQLLTVCVRSFDPTEFSSIEPFARDKETHFTICALRQNR